MSQSSHQGIKASPPLTPLTSPHPHSLPILLQLCDQLITLFDDIIVLLVLVIRPIRLDHAVDAVDIARYAVSRDEVHEIPVVRMISIGSDYIKLGGEERLTCQESPC